MKLAFVSLNDSTDVLQWSGLNYHIARSLERAGATLVRVGPLTHPWTTAMKLRRRWYGLMGHAYHANMEASALDAFGVQAREAIPCDVDAVVAVTSMIAAALDGLRVPVISWDDATPSALTDYYAEFVRLSARSARDAEAMGHRAAANVALALYASEWAAASARTTYGLPAERVAVVPFGANLETLPSLGDVERAIAERSRTSCRLLWVGVDWERKRGDLAVEIAKRIEAHGIPVELTVAGCRPPGDRELPAWVKVEGFVSKRTAAGAARLAELFARSHFLVMPSLAEAYGLVYAEAAAFGVPSVAARTGGVPTVVIDGETGVLDDPTAGAESYAGRVLALLRDRPRYEQMARAASARSAAVLNWDVAGRDALARIGDVVGGRVTRRERRRDLALTPI
ncbi:MAG TPA: glycosyltransferase family 4 protein [Gemmatimonadaceae bacterium]|nr:glycosyltransferase family 4 protein [Gemmatimonadaceae bacterium]